MFSNILNTNLYKNNHKNNHKTKVAKNKFKANVNYLNRKLINKEIPLFKLNAFCINLKSKKENMDFINDEWSDFLIVKRFIALSSATLSHLHILKYIWFNKENIKFPIVIMEDDVFRKNNFTKYWNELLNLKKCDYVAFDCFFLRFKENQDNCEAKFISLKSHNAVGFNVYYKSFFDKITNINNLLEIVGKTIDTTMTNNDKFVKYTPNTQICRQIVNKISSTVISNIRFKTSFYNNYYKDAEYILKIYQKK